MEQEGVMSKVCNNISACIYILMLCFMTFFIARLILPLITSSVTVFYLYLSFHSLTARLFFAALPKQKHTYINIYVNTW